MEDKMIKTLSVFMIAAGMWILASPLLFDYSVSGAALWNSISIGALVIICGSIREWGDTSKSSWASWINFLLGMWLIAAPFMLGFVDFQIGVWNAIISGIAVIGIAGSTVGGISQGGLPRHQH